MRALRFISAALVLATAPAGAVDIDLPTANRHLLTGEPDKFYMYVDRNFEGQATKPWEAGSFGFVRTPARISGQIVLTKFHEGIDISPVNRDKAGNPLDLVMSIADGRVEHVSAVAGRSNYGKYAVVSHQFDGAVFYSLYAHLADITVKPGDPVKKGSVLGRMGFTGAGINRVRAHCHLELCMLMSAQYDGWHRAFSGGTNYHGNFNGMNLTGMDVARLFLESRADPALRIQDFVRNTPPYFKVTVPRKERFDFANRHRWMVDGDPLTPSKSWEITFTATGMPTRIAPSDLEVAAPVVTSVRDSAIQHRHLTRGLIDGSGPTATLAKGGKSLVALLTDDFPPLPAAAASLPAPAAPAAAEDSFPVPAGPGTDPEQ